MTLFKLSSHIKQRMEVGRDYDGGREGYGLGFQGRDTGRDRKEIRKGIPGYGTGKRYGKGYRDTGQGRD
jgi:hypothetical protein